MSKLWVRVTKLHDKVACERCCVSKLCVCDIVVCERSCVCVKVVCDTAVWERVCVCVYMSKLYKLCVNREGGCGGG